jgi:hypothetical protein
VYHVYSDTRHVAQRRQLVLGGAREARQAQRLRAMRRSSRRVERAREQLSHAQSQAKRAAGALESLTG